MIKKDYKFPYCLADGRGKGARWEGDVLYVTFFRYYTDDTDPNEIEIRFHGVEWIRTTCFATFPCDDEDWGNYEYLPEKPIDEYLLLDRDCFNDNYEEFMMGHGFGLNTVRCLEDNVVFIEDRIIFSCTEIKIVRAVCNPNVSKSEQKFEEEYERRYRSK